MARRARDNRKDTPGYDDTRPDRSDRKREHRRVRHAANQMLSVVTDPDDLALPDVRRQGHGEFGGGDSSREPTRFRVWKTKFWKRRDTYHDMKARMDADWPVITSHELEGRGYSI